MNTEIRCTDCGAVISHMCNESAVECMKNLFSFSLGFLPKEIVKYMKEVDGYEDGDEKEPFFSEAFLYPLFGKEDARSILAILSMFIRSLGIDPIMTRWKDRGCRHRFYQSVGKGKNNITVTEWCEDCGAIRRLDDSTGHMGDWFIPITKQKLGKFKKGN